MGCFFGCFRIKDSNPNLVSHPDERVVSSKNALSSLFQCDDESIRKGDECQNQLPGELDVNEINQEAKFLKARGTLPETPVEMKKALAKWDGISGSLVDSPSSCVTDGQNNVRVSSSPIHRRDVQNVITPMDMPDSETLSETSSVSHQVSAQCKNKSVCFDCESDMSYFSAKGSSTECASQHSKQYGSGGNESVTKPSPYPTPLKLADEMQTPGTVYPAYTNDFVGGKTTNVISQYIDPFEDPSQTKELKDDEDNVMSTPKTEVEVKHPSVGNEMINEASLSSWLKPVSPKQHGNNGQFGQISRKNKAPGDRPILGMVAAHWNEDETSHISPKWWDGNGIPNSTNKYKEDQKVSWHVTPFEERLEKALSEETFISQRKSIGRTPPFDFNETEESDTAFSHLQSPEHIKSVVSF